MLYTELKKCGQLANEKRCLERLRMHMYDHEI